MAVQVMAAIERRLGTRDSDPSAIALHQFDPVPEGFRSRRTDVDLAERPPAITVAGYGGEVQS